MHFLLVQAALSLFVIDLSSKVFFSPPSNQQKKDSGTGIF